MTRSSAGRRIKLRKLGRKLKAHFKARPLSGGSYYAPPQDLRNVRSVLSLKPVQDLAIHYVSEPTPAPPSIRHRSVRFSHPAVRHVISALPTPLSTAGRPIPEHSREYEPPANVDFPGQVNPSVIHSRRSQVRNTVLYEEIFDQLDGILAHPRDSKLLQRREEKKKLHNERGSTICPPLAAHAASKPWPVEGICGTKPAVFQTKSGPRALQYLSFHAPIKEEAFSDEAIFGTTSSDKTREQHLQATLDKLSRPPADAELKPRPAQTLVVETSVDFNLVHDQETSTRLPYLAFNTSFRPSTAIMPGQADSAGTTEWERALNTTQERYRSSGIAPPPALTLNSGLKPTVPATPDFPSPQTTGSKRRTLLQSTVLDLGLATPDGLNTAVTPNFPVLNQEREMRRRTIIGEQQRDMLLTPAVTGLALNASTSLPRTFSIPRRGVGQAPKPQAVTGLPLLSSLPDTGEAQSSYTPPIGYSPPSVGFAAQAAFENNNQQRTSSFASQESSQAEFPMRPKRSRMAVFKKIITKTY